MELVYETPVTSSNNQHTYDSLIMAPKQDKHSFSQPRTILCALSVLVLLAVSVTALIVSLKMASNNRDSERLIQGLEVKLNELQVQVEQDKKSLNETMETTNGRDGAPGVAGATGEQRPVDPPGLQGIAGQPGRVHGTVYTRWGRTVCGDNSTLLYAGYIGRGQYDHKGGAVDYHCMYMNPEHDDKVASGFAGSWMSGVEYETLTFGIFPNSAYQQNAPCARCYTEEKPVSMMIPGKRTCLHGWTREYEGYLMSAYYNHVHPATTICVDANPEYVDGESDNDDGGVLYFMRPQCSKGAQCPPYRSDQELTCVVCSK